MLLLSFGSIGRAVARFNLILHGQHSNGAPDPFKTPDLDAVYTFDLKIAQARGLVSYLTGRCAIILYDTMPSEALVRVVKSHKKKFGT